MQKRTFGRTELPVSVLGFGGAPIGYLKTDHERVGRILNLLLDAGMNLIDTAASYPGSEELIAEAVGHRRDQFVIVTKAAGSLPDVPGRAWSDETITKMVDRSLKRLRVDKIDVVLLHSCDLETLKKGEAIGALVKARQAGKIAHAGYSGDNEAAIYAAGHPEIEVVQTSISIADQVNIDKVLPVARQHNVGIMAKRPIANAAWKDVARQPGMYKSYAAEYTDRLRKIKLSPEGLGFPDDSDASWSEMALRFTLSFPEVSTAIVGTTNPDNARSNIATAEKGPLDKNVIEKIRQAFRAADPKGAWLGQT